MNNMFLLYIVVVNHWKDKVLCFMRREIFFTYRISDRPSTLLTFKCAQERISNVRIIMGLCEFLSSIV